MTHFFRQMNVHLRKWRVIDRQEASPCPSF